MPICINFSFYLTFMDICKYFRPEMVVGWYHSHPGFGCWLSGVDINTQQSFEALSERAVAVVVDPIQSVKGKVSTLSVTIIWNLVIRFLPIYYNIQTPEKSNERTIYSGYCL